MVGTLDALQETCRRLQVAVPDDCLERMDRYREMLWRANEKLNLTRHTDLEKFVSRDVVDAVQLAALIDPGKSVLDIGSGGGVPGILVAILRPDLTVDLCEPVGKKARCLEDFVSALGLTSTVYPCRVQEVLVRRPYDVCTARAVGPLEDLCTWLAPHGSAVGEVLAVKGPRWVEERGRARHLGRLRGIQLRKAAEYTTPVTGAHNVILRLALPR